MTKQTTMKEEKQWGGGGYREKIAQLTEEIIKLEDKLWELKKKRMALKRNGTPAILFKGSGWAKNDL